MEWVNTIKIQLENLGIGIAALGTAISCLGVIANNISLDHILAMQLWALSNPLLLIWAIGNYRRWWDGGLSALALIVMYGIFSITNLYGLHQII